MEKNKKENGTAKQAKSSFREEGRRRRRALAPGERASACEWICHFLWRSPEYRRAKRLLVYASLPEEVSTWQIIHRALQEDKQVFCPRTGPLRTRRMDFYRIRSEEELKEGRLGIREPEAVEGNLFTEEAEGDLILVPGIAFDREGRRIGFGGGYYDSFLSGKNLLKMALCFSCQLMEALPEEETDIRTDALVTEKGIVRFSAQTRDAQRAAQK